MMTSKIQQSRLRVKMQKVFFSVFILAFFWLFPSVSSYAESDVKFKVLAVNPSESQPLKSTITQVLPAEINPETDIIDKAGLEVRFDKGNKVYMLVGEVDLKPRESKTFEIRIRDVWKITPEQAEKTKKDLEEQINALKSTKYYDTAKLLYEKAQEGIDRIMEEQSRPVGMKQHIELYRAHVQQLENIQSNALSLGAMRKIEEEKKSGVAEARFLITAENPSSEPKMMTVRSELPKEIMAEDILDKQDFNLLYDQTQNAYILEKQDQFAAYEKKTYIITIRDIWRVPGQEIKFAQEQTEKLLGLFKDSPFAKYAEEQGKMILDILSGISKLQAELDSSLALEDRMRAFVLNSQQMNIAKAKLRNLQQLIPELPLKKDESIIIEKLKNFVKKLAETKDVVLIAMGFKPDAPMTWWIIIGILGFLGGIVVVFYIVWLKQLQKNKFIAPKEVLEAKNSGVRGSPQEPSSTDKEKK